MENFESQTYRANLAKEITNEPHHQKRREILGQAKQTEEYRRAKSIRITESRKKDQEDLVKLRLEMGLGENNKNSSETVVKPELQQYLKDYLNLDSPEKMESIKFVEARDLDGEYAEQYKFLDDERLAGTIIAIVPDQLWIKGRQPSESDAERGLILIREGYMNNPAQQTKDKIAWMSHELGHIQRFKDNSAAYQTDTEAVAYNDIRLETYPNNKVEEHAFTRQFEYLKSQGVTKDEILEMLKDDYEGEDFKFFEKLLDKTFARTAVDKPEKVDVYKEKIEQGKGLEVIGKIGWKDYRKNVYQCSYADFIRNQAAQIATLESQPQPQKPEWVISQENAQAAERAGKLSKWMIENYGKDKSANFIAYQDGNKKLMVRGRNIRLNKDGAPTELPVTRVYLTVPTRTSPEAMRALFTTMTDEGAMANTDLALNLENYQGQSANKSFENNTLVLYVYGDKPEVLSKVAKAIQRAKQESKPELWQLPAGDLAQAKKEMAADFMVPLDDTTAFVEADNLGSYHQGPRGRIYTDLTGEMPGQKIDLNKLQKSMETFTPTRPGLFDQDKNRRRYMPALILK